MTKETELLHIIKQDVRVMDILGLARKLELPNWYIGAGVIRNTVWDVLHGTPGVSPIRDVDFIYFSKDPINEEVARKIVVDEMPNIKWDIKNSAFVHQWYKEKKGRDRKPLNSSEEDIDNWPEPASCIGLRLLGNDEILIYAPYGLDDLMNMIFRRNTKGELITPEIFQWRLENKRITERWPKVTVVYE